MLRSILILLLWTFSLAAQMADFDVVVIGSSPFSLLEALYRYHMGNSVLILEQDEVCGGAWRTVDVCGVAHVDLGCHQIGRDAQLLHFFEDYVGCKMVSLNNPLVPYMSVNPDGYYFSGGCHELMSCLLDLIGKTQIVLLLNHRLESVKIDPVQPIAILKTQDKTFIASKIVASVYTDIQIEGHSKPPSKSKYPHLYILIEDPSCPRFSYHGSIGSGISRMMNLTYFAGLNGTGQQLIVFQCSGSLTFETGENYLKLLKEKELVHESAKLLTVDSYIYEQHYNRNQIHEMPNGKEIFETLSSGHIQNLSQYISKWKMALKPIDSLQ